MTKRYSRRDALLTGAALLTLPAASRAFTFGERDQWEDYAGLSSRASSYSGMSGTAGVRVSRRLGAQERLRLF